MSGQLSGIDNVINNMSHFKANVIDGLVRTAQISAAKIANDAAQNHPYTDRTGHLTQAVAASPASAVVDINDKEVSATIQINRAYASYVEFMFDKGRSKKNYAYARPAITKERPFFIQRVRTTIQGSRP